MSRLTKTAATKEARRQLSYGHFVPKRPALPWVQCPRCRRPVTADPLPWEKPTPHLLIQLTGHLLEDHQEDTA